MITSNSLQIKSIIILINFKYILVFIVMIRYDQSLKLKKKKKKKDEKIKKIEQPPVERIILKNNTQTRHTYRGPTPSCVIQAGAD